MRWLKMSVVVPICAAASCSQVATIPSPFEPTETQMAEPQPVARAATPEWQQIGTSIRGKPIEAMTLGGGPRKIYILGGFHGDEPEGPEAAAKLPAALVPEMISEAGEKSTIRIVRDMNPDGTALKTKGNTRGTDLNRNWPTSDFISDPKRGGKKAESELETTAILKDLVAFKPDVVIVFETAVTGRGPDVAVENGGAGAVSMAYDFASAARTIDPRWRVATETRYRTPGSVQSYVGRNLRKPVVTVQFRRGEDAQTNVTAVTKSIVEMAKAEIKGAAAKATPKNAKAAGKPVAVKPKASALKPTPTNQTVTVKQAPRADASPGSRYAVCGLEEIKASP